MIQQEGSHTRANSYQKLKSCSQQTKCFKLNKNPTKPFNSLVLIETAITISMLPARQKPVGELIQIGNYQLGQSCTDLSSVSNMGNLQEGTTFKAWSISSCRLIKTTCFLAKLSGPTMESFVSAYVVCVCLLNLSFENNVWRTF